jgi:thiol-disulfide isomerase/thioredoxin
MINPKRIFILLTGLLFSVNTMAQSSLEYYAREIALASVNGDTLKLSGLKGKVVLIDFWASWCVPCRASNKRLTKLYPKYKDQGFEIFSVSLDDNLEDWKKAIRKDKVSWLQVIDPRGWEAQTARDWNIYALPTSFLIDKSGKLIAMDLEGRELESAVKELLGK